MYEYKKPWYSFGIIKKIYYSKYHEWLVELTNGTFKYLRDCRLEDFYYSSDKSAYLKAINNIHNLDDLVIFGNMFDDFD